MSDENQKAEGESVQAPEMPAPEKERPAPSSHAPERGASHPDYAPHFDKVFAELGKMPEYLVNAIREAIPPAPPKEEKAEEKEDDGEPAPVTPGKKGQQNADEKLSAEKTPAKKTFGHKWLGK